LESQNASQKSKVIRQRTDEPMAQKSRVRGRKSKVIIAERKVKGRVATKL